MTESHINGRQNGRNKWNLLLYKSEYPLDSLVRFGWEIGTYTILNFYEISI